tara:strand:+ start:869 stop:1288 length:420 start_codon:yes stop_codon:yes gene_type:complete
MTHNTREEWEDEFDKLVTVLNTQKRDVENIRIFIKSLITSQRHQERKKAELEALQVVAPFFEYDGHVKPLWEIVDIIKNSTRIATVKECLDSLKLLNYGYKEFDNGNAPILEITDPQMKKGYRAALSDVEQSLTSLIDQ